MKCPIHKDVEMVQKTIGNMFMMTTTYHCYKCKKEGLPKGLFGLSLKGEWTVERIKNYLMKHEKD